MKARTGYLYQDKSRKRWVGRVTFTDPETGERKSLKCYATTKTEARDKLDDLKERIRKDGAHSVVGEKMTFHYLARRFKKEKLVPAVYVGERKIAGRRELSSAEAWLKQLRLYFDKHKLSEITPGEIRKFKVWLSKIPTRSTIEEVEGELVLTINENGEPRSIEALHRPVELLRTMLNYAVDERLLRTEQNPFGLRRGKGLIDRDAETRRERFPTFGEEFALINHCTIEGEFGNAHLRPVLIIAADTGLRHNELFTLKDTDLDFERGIISVRAINAKTNRKRQIPMTPRVKEQLLKLVESKGPGLVFGTLKEVKRSFATACRANTITDLNKHDLRHAFVSRAILAGIPPAVALSASGHSSDEWKRYLNMTPDQLQFLLEPLPGQEAEQVRTYAEEVMCGLKEALRYGEVERLLMPPPRPQSMKPVESERVN